MDDDPPANKRIVLDDSDEDVNILDSESESEKTPAKKKKKKKKRRKKNKKRAAPDDKSDASSGEDEGANKETKPRKKKKKRRQSSEASDDKPWVDPRQGGASRGGDSVAPKRDEDSVVATLEYAALASGHYSRKSDGLQQHSFASFHTDVVSNRNEHQRVATEGVKRTCLQLVDYLAKMNEVVDPHSPIFPFVDGNNKMFTAKNKNTKVYYVKDRRADGNLDGKIGVGGESRADEYEDAIGEEDFERDITMTSVVDIDNIVTEVQRHFTQLLLDGLRPLGCQVIPVTVFDLVECSRMGLPAALQLAILLLDTPSTQCNDLGGLMEISGWLLEFAKFAIETGVKERALRRLRKDDPAAATSNFRQPNEWLRCNEIGAAVAGQQHGYSQINWLLTLLPPRVRETFLKGRHSLEYMANWKPGVNGSKKTKDRQDSSRGTANLYAKLCPDAQNFMNAQETPPTGDRVLSSSEIDDGYNPRLYTREQNKESCAKRDGVLLNHAINGGGLLVLERCPTSMTERGGLDMVLYVMNLRPFKDMFEDDESTGVEPRWIPVLDEKTGEPLLLLERIVFLYMEVGWDDELRIVAVVNNPSDMFDSNTNRPQTWALVGGAFNDAMAFDGLNYARTLLEAENAQLVEKIDIRTMHFRESFSAMFSLNVYYKMFLKLPSKSSSLLLQNLMQAPGVNLHLTGYNGLRRDKADYDLIGSSARAEERQSANKETGIIRDNKVNRSIVAGGSNGSDLDECVDLMIEAALQNRKNGSAEIADPKEKSRRLREFVNKAREDEFIEEELIDRFEDKRKSMTANSGNASSHNHSGYDTLETRDGELTQFADTGDKFLVQVTGKAQ